MNDGSLNKFIKAYNHIILETALEKMKNSRVASASRKNLLYKPKSLNEILASFNNAFWIDYEDDIIVESNLIDPIEDLCEKVLNAKEKITFTNNEALSLIDSSWRFYNDLKSNGKPLIFLKFNFSDESQMTKSLSYLMSAIDNESDIKTFMESFKDHSNSYGVFIDFDDSSFFLLNSIKYTKRTIVHEFIHYALCIIDESSKVHYEMNKIDSEMLNFLNISNEMKKEILDVLNDEDEAIAHLSECYEGIINAWNEHKNLGIKKKDYVDYFLSVILNSNDIENEDIFKMYKLMNEDMLPLYVMIVCYKYDLNWKSLKSFIFDD